MKILFPDDKGWSRKSERGRTERGKRERRGFHFRRISIKKKKAIVLNSQIDFKAWVK